ncbi:MAG: alcohol dehydrogenase catalytic domain-containing protein [Candidatus Thiodiazotropha sp. (ex Ustalcina ferruginea)]|nr:alcohol dehydrogenase catalytic domain-containing protein [Candidatus Thiodiazotropha sp. (ex Ustalcina ferruginea)]
MKTAVFKKQYEPLVIEDRPLPVPGLNQLLVRVRAVGICGSDLHASEAEWTPSGIVMGHEFSGEVAAIGPGVRDWAVGDRILPMVNVVCGECENCKLGIFENCSQLEEIGYNRNHTGTYAEYILVSAPNSLRLPANIGYDAAAVIEPLAVGYDAVRRCSLEMNEAVLVIGAGPIGLSVIQWCNHFGVADIAVSELNTNRLDRAREMGATQVIDGNQFSNPVEEFERQVGRPPSVIFEAVGLPGMIQQCVRMAVKDTRIVIVGVCMQSDQFEPMECIVKRVSLIFAMGYSLQDYAIILRLLEQKRIIAEPLISHRISLDELPEMFERLRKPTDQVKVIVQP